MATTPPARIGLAFLSLAALSMTILTGCDLQPPQASLHNSRDSSVTLTLTGSEVDPQEFPANEGRGIRGVGGRVPEGADDCVGEGFIVTDTATGGVLGTSKEPLCGDTTIFVKDDGTVTP